VSRRRLVSIAVALTALLAVVAVAARGRPLSSSAGTSAGPPPVFFDYFFTTFLIVVAFAAIAAVAVLFILRPDVGQRQSFHARTIRALVLLFGITALIVLIGRYSDVYRLLHPHHGPASRTHATAGGHGKPGSKSVPSSRPLQFRWEELVAVLGLLLVLGAASAANRSRLRAATRGHELTPEALAAVLDESLDDLRTDPDLRRAIVAAYARMEVALAAAGIPRRPAEAPLEYLERALLGLDTSAEAVRRLTHLFEWARFSQYEPEPAMRDEAVDALVAVRDELRASEPVVA
jgi:hypothetical protein